MTVAQVAMDLDVARRHSQLAKAFAGAALEGLVRLSCRRVCRLSEWSFFDGPAGWRVMSSLLSRCSVWHAWRTDAFMADSGALEPYGSSFGGHHRCRGTTLMRFRTS